MIFSENKKSKAWIFSGLLAVLVLGGTPNIAMAQSNWGTDSNVEGRIKRIENEVQTLSRAVYRGEAPPVDAMGDAGAANNGELVVRMQQIETEMQSLRGMIEEQAHEIRQMKADLERNVSDMELRLNDVEGRSGGSSSASSSESVIRSTSSSSADEPTDRYDDSRGLDASESTERKDEDGYSWSTNNKSDSGVLGRYNTTKNEGGDQASAAYDSAFSMVKNRQYKGAADAFGDFLRDYPDHALAGNAKYWLGETHYVRGNFEVAARLFAEGYKQYPKGAKAGDNLLKLGLSLEGMGKSEDACVALGQLDKNGVGGTPLKRRAEQEMSRIGCS